jgi:hypothetical protein
MTYRRDSDIYRPYQLVIPTKPNEGKKEIEQIDMTWQKKSKGILWFVSNCKTDHTGRIDFAKALEKETKLKLDIYGRCGKGYVSKEVETAIWEDYKFYLAFENSHCRDYISEKFFKVLNKDVIPVVRGAPIG